jgi:hypothetical protein
MNELTIHYSKHTTINTALQYSRQDPSWITISLNLISLLTPEILQTRLKHDLGIEISQVLAQLILEYPRSNDIDKDVTVVFPY